MSIKHLESHFAQYKCAIRYIAQPLSIDSYEEVAIGLLSRDTLAEDLDLAERLWPLDAAFARALGTASRQWLLEVMRISSSFAQAAWWQSILRAATEEPAELQKAS
jgi:hypothetical protein